MVESVWYKRRDEVLHLLEKYHNKARFNSWEIDRFETILDKTSLVTYYTHDEEDLTPEYIELCKIKINRYEAQQQLPIPEDDKGSNKRRKTLRNQWR